MIIKDVKFSYNESKYGLGPYIEFFSELEVPSLEYGDIVKAIKNSNPDYKDIKVMSYIENVVSSTKDTLKLGKNDKIFFTANTHWGQQNIIRYLQRPFNDIKEMDETLIANWNNIVGKDDIIFHLGNFAKGGIVKWNKILERLNGKKYLITSYHDMKTIGKGQIRLEHVAMQMLINIGGQQIYLNHSPLLFYGESKNTWQLYGNVHTNLHHTGTNRSIIDNLLPTQYDVGVDNNNFTPVSYEQICAKIQQQIITQKEQRA